MNTLTFDFLRIPEWKDIGRSAVSMTVVQSLSLPKLKSEATIHAISCRAEPNPMGSGAEREDRDLLPIHSRPFHSSASEAIILFNIYAQHQTLWTFSLVIHRKSLLALLPPLQDSNYALSVEASGGQVTPHPGEMQDESFSGSEDESGVRHLEPIPWAEWGPSISRWIKAQDHTARWITSSTGQRLVLIDDPTWRVEQPIIVFDFNPRHRCPHSNTSHELLCANEDGPFEEDVYSELPFGWTISEESYDFDAVLMDDERVIGMRVRNVNPCV
jgi:hypothetical protein